MRTLEHNYNSKMEMNVSSGQVIALKFSPPLMILIEIL